MQTLDFSPFLRSTVGFDRIFNSLDSLNTQENKAYPPYNIERINDDTWHVLIAVAGFSTDDIDVETKEANLVIRGSKQSETEQETRDFLHRGIAERDFELRFQLGDYVEVLDANLKNGLLDIALKREIPENKKTRKIAVNNGAEKNHKKVSAKSVN